MKKPDDPMFDIEGSKNVNLEDNITAGKIMASIRDSENFSGKRNVALGQRGVKTSLELSRMARFRAFMFKIFIEKPLEKAVLWGLTLLLGYLVSLYLKGK